MLTTAARCVVFALHVLAPLADPVRMASGAREAFEAAQEDCGLFPAFGRLMLQRHRWHELCKSPKARERLASPTPPRSPRDDKESHDIEAMEILEATELLIFMSPVLDRILPLTPSAAINVATTCKLPIVHPELTSVVSTCGKRACIFGCRCLSSISFASLVVSLYNEYERSTDEAHGRALLLSMFLSVLLTRLLVAAPAHVRPLVQCELPGASWKEQLTGLAERLGHFRSVYARVRAQISGAAELGDEGDTMLDEALGQLGPLIASAD